MSRARARIEWAIVPVVTLASIAIWAAGIRGVDHPAHAFRVELFRDYGLTTWNSQWYGGHHTPGYGIAYPALAAWFGEPVVAIAATVASVALFALLVSTFVPARRSARLGSIGAFAALALINLWEGRLPFAVGTVVALVALHLALRRRWAAAMVVAALSALASPLAAAFIALVGAAWALAACDRSAPLTLLRQPAGWWAVAAVVPVVGAAWLYPQGGSMPYIWQHFALTVLTAGAAVTLVPERFRAVRVVAGLCVVAGMLFFFVPTPVGANLVRFGAVAGPAVIALIDSRWGWLLGAVVVGWHASPLIDLPAALDAPAQEAAFHQPMIDQVMKLSDGPVRIEIPFTERHWEATHVASQVAIARGWERQLDYRFNGDIIDTELDESTYLQWLHETGVSFVAVPDVALEAESRRQAELVRSSDGLARVWGSGDWELYEVRDATPLVDGSAVLIEVAPDRIELAVERGGTYQVRVRFSPAMRSSGACLRESKSGWTLVEVESPGTVVIEAASLFDRVFGAPCD